MADVEMDAEALVAGGQQMLDRRERAASIRLIITGVASTAMRPEPTNGAVWSGVTTSLGVPVRPGVMRVRSIMVIAGVAQGPPVV